MRSTLLHSSALCFPSFSAQLIPHLLVNPPRPTQNKPTPTNLPQNLCVLCVFILKSQPTIGPASWASPNQQPRTNQLDRGGPTLLPISACVILLFCVGNIFREVCFYLFDKELGPRASRFFLNKHTETAQRAGPRPIKWCCSPYLCCV